MPLPAKPALRPLRKGTETVLLYTDIISGDELFTDAFPVKEVAGRYEVEGRLITVSGDVHADIDANPNEVEAAEDTDGTRQVIDVIHAHRLQPTSFDKKSYTVYAKGYLKAVKSELSETDPGSVAAFEAEGTALVKEVLGNFQDYEFYTGESMNPDGMVALLNYRDDGTTPYLTFFQHGVHAHQI
ncbi:translationally-controlled tumor protein [Streptomyces sp. NPDC101132]|uniref:translationally-controlled tumor protein n=1 Tax=Streptomyces sp. NPDC101132 TaxID=3366110 RepID=UPI003812C496